MAASLEHVLDKIADKLITSGEFTPSTLRDNQKTIRNGTIELVRSNSEKLLLFETDINANQEDLGQASVEDMSGNTSGDTSLQAIINTCIDNDDVVISNTFTGGSGGTGPYLSDIYLTCDGGEWNISNLVQNNMEGYNVSQFMNLIQSGSTVDSDQAHEFLDTNIYELLPVGKTRQERIDDLFAEVENLKGTKPNFPDYTDQVTGDIDAEPDYEENHDISYAQENEDGIDEEEAFITRLNIDANTDNADKTIQSLRDTLNTYLLDIDQVIEAELEDSRPEYKEKSDGYIKIRNLNQGIIIRKQEGDDIGIEQEITIDNTDHPHYGTTGPSYLMDGFTISMWVRFLDKTTKGTLFNYGNPLRAKDPRGFMLETFVLNKDDIAQSGNTWYTEATGTDVFSTSDSERFIRLVVYDHLPEINSPHRRLYDSSKGIPGLPKSTTHVPEFGMTGTAAYAEGDESAVLGHTRVPVDFDEWYFIVANFNPMVDNTLSYVSAGYSEDPNYWNGNKCDTTPSSPNCSVGNSFTHFSGLGNKCKVEIISKTDLLRARGYKV